MKLKICGFVLFSLSVAFAPIEILLAMESGKLSDGEEQAHREQGPVGSVTLVLGRAFLDSGGNQLERLRAGDLVGESDLILTESSGHVHIKFVDNALISIRPNSKLEIIEYKFDADQPGKSIVKFNLITGTARAVSGEAANAAKQRFRLNTPVAAIGVRGTDFVVTTNFESVTALVNEGSIVVAPFSEECTFQGAGPCSANAVELNAQSMQILEFDTTLREPRLIQLEAPRQNPVNLQDLPPSPDTATPDQVADTANFEEADQNSVSTDDVSESVSPTDMANKVSTDVVSESVTSVDLTDDVKKQAPYQTGYTPANKLDISEARERQLVWGRYSDGKGALERISVPFSEATKERSVTVGDFEYFLFRANDKEDEMQTDAVGTVGFSLNSAQAYYDNGTVTSPVAVTSGDLTIDFQKSEFATSLNLHHLEFGKSVFNSNGKLRDGGYFNSYAPDGSQGLAGALSLDISEAGYFFDLINWHGVVQGLTLWDSLGQ